MATHNLSLINGLPLNRRNVDLRNTITMTNYGVSLVCNESYFTEEITQKIANNELFTRSDFPVYPHFFYVGMDDISEFTINSLTVRHREYDGYAYSNRVDFLIAALETNTTIKCLDMSNCIFRLKSIKELIKRVSKNTTIETLFLTNSYMGLNFTGVFSNNMMAYFIQNNTTVKYLYLLDGLLNSVSFEYEPIIKALEYNTTLKILYMGENLEFRDQVIPSSIHTISNVFSINQTLEEFTFTIWYDMMEPLLAIFEKSTTLIKINISVKWPPGVHDLTHEISEFQKNISRIVERNIMLKFAPKLETFILASTRKQLFLPDELWRPVFAKLIS